MDHGGPRVLGDGGKLHHQSFEIQATQNLDEAQRRRDEKTDATI